MEGYGYALIYSNQEPVEENIVAMPMDAYMISVPLEQIPEESELPKLV